MRGVGISLGGLGGTVWVKESRIGGKPGRRERDGRKGRAFAGLGPSKERAPAQEKAPARKGDTARYPLPVKAQVGLVWGT